MQNVSLAQSMYVHESYLFKTPRQATKRHSKPTPDIQSIFFDNINHSYLAQLSGNVKEDLPKEKIYASKADSRRERPRIDFSTYQGLSTDQIYQSSFFKADWDLFEIVSLLENAEKEVRFDQENLFCCSGERGQLICRGKIAGPSQFELIREGTGLESGPLFFSINFDAVKGHVYFNEIRSTCEIVITASNYTLIIEPFDRRAGRWWNKHLQKMSLASIGTSLPLRILSQTPHFYQRRFQTESYFLENCQNGDILLFQDNHFFARAQRFLTQSQFDHVGMVVRDKKHGILIFQSNNSSGVCLTPWKYVAMFEWYRTIPRIAWRRLFTDRSFEFNQALEQFVVKNLPKQFHFSLAKLTAQESFIMVDQSRKEGELSSNETNGYFCSELAAATYKHLGLLTADRNNARYLPASRFYPKDFSDEGALHLEVGYLGEERDIVFEGQERTD